MNDQNDEIEIEIKIALAPEKMEAIFQAFVPRAIGGVSDKHHPRDYYDTSDCTLRGKNAVLRVQYKDDEGNYEQSIKHKPAEERTGEDEDMQVVSEWNMRIPTATPDLNAITHPQARALFADIQPEDLQHLFTTDIQRRFFTIDVPLSGEADRGQVELAFDEGAVRLPTGEAVALNEIEIELKSGPVTAVQKIRDEILSLEPEAQTHHTTKGSYGYALYQDKNR